MKIYLKPKLKIKEIAYPGSLVKLHIRLLWTVYRPEIDKVESVCRLGIDCEYFHQIKSSYPGFL